MSPTNTQDKESFMTSTYPLIQDVNDIHSFYHKVGKNILIFNIVL